MSACVRAAFKQTPTITRDEILTIIEEIAESRTLPTGITPQRFIDARVFRELSESGFVDGLYRGR